MSAELDYLSRLAAKGKLSRRDFLGRAAALGVGAFGANALLSGAAMAEGPQKGGTLRAGMVGGGATDSLDPGSWTNQIPYTLGRCWGEQLLDVRPDGGVEPKLAEEYSSSPDARRGPSRSERA
jgi:peptide/nickel transport system substrate-binding protein